MVPALAIEGLAAAAHMVWCSAMERDGWRGGERFSPAEKIHDAIAPFQKLHPLDRRTAIDAAERLAYQVMQELNYPRGADREFTADDIRVGQKVKLTRGSHRSGAADDSFGRVTSWEGEPDSPILRTVRVAWDDGEVTEHIPSLRDLQRI
jgi:hypothetical protein